MFALRARLSHHRLSRSVIAVLALVIVFVALPSHAAAQYVHIRLNQPLSPDQRILPGPNISPDGAHVLYVLSTEGESEMSASRLYSVPITGGTPVLLSPWPSDEMPASIVWFQISPDSEYVIYKEEIYGEEGAEMPVSSRLYNIPITGGVPVRLNPSADGEVGNLHLEFRISPDFRHVVYVENSDGGGDINNLRLPRLYSVPITGGVPVRLNSSPDCEEVNCHLQIWTSLQFWISGDSSHVVYVENNDGDPDTLEPDLFKLYSVPISGGVPVPLSLSAGIGMRMAHLQISQDAHVVYVQYVGQEPNALPVYELYSVPIGGGVPVRLNPSAAAEPFWFRISPDSRYVVYEKPVPDRPDAPDLYSVPISGGASVQLEFPVEFLDINGYTFSADSRHIVVYCHWRHLFEIYSFPIEGGKPIRLSDALELHFGRRFTPAPRFLLSVDDTQVLYVTWDDERKQHVLVAVPTSGGAPAELAAGAGPTQVLNLWSLMPDGAHALYTVHETSATELPRTYLHSASLKNGTSVRLMELAGTNYYGDDWSLTPSLDASRVVVFQNGIPGIVSVPVTGGVPAVLEDEGCDLLIGGLNISPDSSRVLYTGCSSNHNSVYLVPIEGGTAAVMPSLVGAWFSPDGAHFVYQTGDSDLYVYTDATDWLHTFLPRLKSP